MKRNLNKFIGIALISSLGFTACKHDVVKEDVGMAAILASAISSAASGACMLSINAGGIYYGLLIFHTVNNTNTQGFSQADYTLATGTTLTSAQWADTTYEEKYRAFFLDNGTSWTTTLRNTRLAAVKASFDTATNGFTGTSALQLLPGTGILACARIPKTSCSVAGLTTTTRADDIAAGITTYNNVINNADCRRPSSTFPTMLAKSIFRGTPSTTALAVSGGTIFNTPTNGVPVSNTGAILSTATILPEGMYPKSAALVSQNFGSLMPINKLGTEYPTSTSSTTSTAFYGGTNLTVTSVPSCEAYGFEYGLTPDVAETLRKPLTPPAEVAYAFSANGTAAAAYQAAIQLTTIDSGVYQTTATAGTLQDAVNCNNSFRAKSPISVALGGGKLGTTNGGAQNLAFGDGKGDDRASSLLSLCVYGGTSTKRAVLKGVVGSSTLVAVGQIGASSDITTCGQGRLATHATGQSTVATAFKEVGTFSTFPDSN